MATDDEASDTATDDEASDTAMGELFVAISEGDVAAAKSAIESGADVNANYLGITGATALMEACSARCDKDLFAVLLEAGADPNCAENFGSTPLLDALLYNLGPEVIALLLAHGADARAVNSYGRTVLHYREKAPVIKLLLDAGADAKAIALDGTSTLHNQNDPESMVLLLEAGADVNAVDEEGKTPLHSAAKSGGFPDVVAVLIAHGATVDVYDNENVLPIYYAARGSNAATVKALIDGGADANLALLEAARNGHIATARVALEGGASLDARATDNPDDQDSTPLLLALSTKSSDMALFLLEAGADPTTPSNAGRTPLHCSWWDPTVVSRLLASVPAVDVNAAESIMRETPLHVAARRGKAETVALLIAARADVNAQNNSQETPFHVSAGYSNLEATQAILMGRPNVGLADCNGETAHDVAVENGQTEIAAMIAAYQATELVGAFFAVMRAMVDVRAAETMVAAADGKAPPPHRR